MSESVNFKVVLGFIVFIFIFAGIGLFGLFNKDLIEDKNVTTTTFVPVVESDKTIICSGEVERASIKYDFILNKDNTIKNIRVTYNAIDGIQEDYQAALTLANTNLSGFNPTLKDQFNNFMLTLYINRNNVDMNALSVYKPYFDTLHIVVDSASTYDEYHALINNMNNFKCEITK